MQRILRLLSAIIFFTSFAYGATITGSVKGPDGAPFKGAFVQAQNTKTGSPSMCCLKRTAVSIRRSASGDYELRFGQLVQCGSRTGVKLSETQAARLMGAAEGNSALARPFSLPSEKLIPNIRGKEMVFVLGNFRDALAKSATVSDRMASVSRDAREQKIAWNTCDQGCIFSSQHGQRRTTDRVISFISAAFGRLRVAEVSATCGIQKPRANIRR